jgi:hypothetical protein
VAKCANSKETILNVTTYWYCSDTVLKDPVSSTLTETCLWRNWLLCRYLAYDELKVHVCTSLGIIYDPVANLSYLLEFRYNKHAYSADIGRRYDCPMLEVSCVLDHSEIVCDSKWL